MRRWLTVPIVLVGFAVPAFAPGRADAWGKEGHALVGKIADKFLTSQAREAIDELLQGHQFHSLSDERLPNWADAIRGSSFYRKKFPNMAKWHFIDISVTADLTNPDLNKFCPEGNCALAAIKKFQGILKDPDQPLQNRREALFFIVHFIGDIHQPLHCAERNNDRGGNLVRVFLEGDDVHVSNLHKVWDTNLVQEAMGPLGMDDYAKRLAFTLSSQQRKALQKGTPEDWILESHKIARANVYKDKGVAIPANGNPHTLSSDYILEGAEIVEGQITRGGVRLALFLNDTFKD
jgi:hypothetical protein